MRSSSPTTRAARSALVLPVLVVAAPLLVGRVLYYGDITLQFVPWRSFARQQLLAGHLPWWLPGLFGGLPLVGNDQSAVFYPWHWLCLPLAPARAVALGAVLHLWLGVAGGFCLLRALGRGRAAAALGALACGLSGFVVSKQQFPSLAYTMAWLPWLLWAGLRLWAAPGLGTALVLAAIVGVQWLGGHAQMSFLQLVLTAGLLACRGRGSEAADHPLTPSLARRGKRDRRWAWALAAVALGTALGLVQILPTLELLALSPRTQFRLADVARFYLLPWELGLVLAPRLYGAPEATLAWLGHGAYWEALWYVGLPTLPLALAAVRRHPGWALLALLGVLLALGPRTLVYGWCYALLPPVRMFRDPARFVLYTVLALAVLAAHGLDESPAGARRVARGLTVLVAVGLLAVVLAPPPALERVLRALLADQPTKSVGDLRPLALAWQNNLTLTLLGGVALLAASAWLLGQGPRVRRIGMVALLAADLAWHGLPLNPTAPAGSCAADPRPAALRAVAAPVHFPVEHQARWYIHWFSMAQVRRPTDLGAARATLVPDVTIATPLRLVNGYDPLAPAAVMRWLREVERLPAPAREALLGGLGVAGEWDGERWRPYAAPAPEATCDGRACRVDAPTPQRRVVAAADGQPLRGTLRLWQTPLPGWRATPGALVRSAGPPVQTTCRLSSPSPLVRLWYAPLSARLGLFGSLLAAACLAAALVVHKMFRQTLNDECGSPGAPW